MNIILLLKKLIIAGLKIFFIIFILMNSVLILPQETSFKKLDRNNYSYLLDPAINLSSEANCSKSNLKLLPESFAQKFFSCGFCLNKPGSHTKIITIICETISESNSRNSTFLVTELSTST